MLRIVGGYTSTPSMGLSSPLNKLSLIHFQAISFTLRPYVHLLHRQGVEHLHLQIQWNQFHSLPEYNPTLYSTLMERGFNDGRS